MQQAKFHVNICVGNTFRYAGKYIYSGNGLQWRFASAEHDICMKICNCEMRLKMAAASDDEFSVWHGWSVSSFRGKGLAVKRAVAV